MSATGHSSLVLAVDWCRWPTWAALGAAARPGPNTPKAVSTARNGAGLGRGPETGRGQRSGPNPENLKGTGAETLVPVLGLLQLRPAETEQLRRRSASTSSVGH